MGRIFNALSKRAEDSRDNNKKSSPFFRRLKLKLLGAASSFLLFIVVVMLIPIMIINQIASFLDIASYEQECPELVRAYLADNYEKFEQQVRSYCDDPDFIAYVANSEFDNAYTKLVYGGTNAYSQSELKGNAEGVQGQKASWVSYDSKKKKYSAKSVLSTINDYLNDGVSESKIFINDNYLKGFGDSSGTDKTDKASAQTFGEWINYSYYNVPYYYHWNMAVNSEYVSPVKMFGYTFSGDDVGLPSWLQDSVAQRWRFMLAAEVDGKNVFDDKTLEALGLQTVGQYKNISYGDYLNSNFTAVKSYNKKYNAQGVMLGYSQSWIDENKWLTKALNYFGGRDVNVEYSAFSKYAIEDSIHTGHSLFSKIENDLDIYNWYNKKSKKNNKKTNYEEYLKTPKNTNVLSKREGVVNSEVSNWKDKFAEYFAKEIYYVYPNKRYVVDFFMGSDATRKQKIAFLQRSFYAMATGSSLECTIDEEYEVSAGKIRSKTSGNIVGKTKIKSVQLESVVAKYCESLKVGFLETSDKKFVNQEELINEFNAWSSLDDRKSFKAVYSAAIKVTYSDNVSETIENIPIEINVDKNLDTKLTFNAKGYKNGTFKKHNLVTVNKQDISDVVNKHFDKDNWSEVFYKTQYSADQYEGTEGGVLKEGAVNPLDGLKIKCKNFTFTTKSWESLNSDSIKGSEIKDRLNSSLKYDSSNLKDKNGKEVELLDCNFVYMFSGTIKGEREIDFKYSDHSFLSYDVNEIKDGKGNVKEVNIEIYMYYPDLSKYDDGEYRIAYGFEKKGAISEAYKLLQYANDNQSLEGVSDEIDFSELIIGYEEKCVNNGTVVESGDFVDFCVSVVKACEGGSYDSADCGSLGEGFTVGIGQWYGSRAWSLLKKICSKEQTKSKAIIGEELYNKIMKGTGDMYPGSEELSNLRKLLKTKWGKKVQDEQYRKDVSAYIEQIHSKYKITDERCVAYITQLIHNTPGRKTTNYYWGTPWVMEQFIEHYGSAKKANSAKDNLKVLHQIAMTSMPFKRVSRRCKVSYEMCLKYKNISAEVTKDVAGVIKWARSKVGCNYDQGNRYGGLTGNTYDCSSFVYYAWTVAGVKLCDAKTAPTAHLEYNWCKSNCKSSSIGNMRPGDLIFYDYQKDGHIDHVAIYVGSNEIVEAANDTQGVIIHGVKNSAYIVGIYSPNQKKSG